MADPRPPDRWQMNVTDLTIFDPVIAHACAWASYYAYYDHAADFLMKLMGGANVYRIPADPSKGRPQGFVVDLPEASMVVFAGTTDAQQLYGIFRDALYGRLANQPANVVVHYGVAAWVADILATNAQLFRDLMAARKTIWCGHSIGGALAVALETAMQGDGAVTPLPHCYYTFGAPRVGNLDFAAQSLGGFSCVVAGDPVPKLPPFGMLRLGNPQAVQPSYTVHPGNGFRNNGSIVYLNPGSETQQLPAGTRVISRDAPIEFDAARFFFESFGLTDPTAPARTVVAVWNDTVETHEMRVYLDRLENMLPVSSGQHAAMGDSGKKAEAELPPDPSQFGQFIEVPVYRINTPPSAPTPLASNGVTPLHLRSRH